MPITSTQLYALCAHAEVDQKTGRNWLNPDYRPRMKPIVAQRLARAAAELGLPIPQKALEKSA